MFINIFNDFINFKMERKNMFYLILKDKFML